MKITWLKLENFRRFSHLEIDFHPELTVLIARNGQGKSTILEAICAAFGTYVGSFDMGKAEHIAQTDVRLARLSSMPESEPQYPTAISADSSVTDSPWKRELTGPKNKTTIKDAAPISDFGKSLQDQLRSDQDVDLPLIAYYGTARLWKAHKNMSRKSVLTESRTMGYEDCLSPASNFTQLQQWLAKATLASLQQEQMPEYEGKSLKDRIQGIQQAVNTVLASEGWSNFHYSLTYEELAMAHEDHGILPVSILSDGVRAMISLVADIAFRCVRLNGHYGKDAILHTKGVALIDEVDLHLHPEWQQKVISQLREAFPKIQLVVTTHSPQVLSTVRKENIRILNFDEYHSPEAIMPMAKSYGEESQNVMQAIMGVDPIPPIPEKSLLDELTQLVDSGEYFGDRAQALLSEVKGALSDAHPQVQRIERSIRRQEALKR
ncbi:AAA family ATPase [Microbulbifer sp. CNSA002]|uniref:AAA family ATPase n=1 Tax=Microbulbifer sp. CNSA002 TaxID=3373604 RepID=UPI0039B3F025